MVTAALINDTLSAVGAIGGLLSIVGVGLLILLVASQSRQIRAMREWIEQEPQRQQETAQRVIAEVQRRIAAARERRTGVPVPPESTLPGVPGAAAGVKPAPGTLGATPEAQAIAARQAATGNPPTEAQTPGFAPLTPAGGSDAGSIPPPPPPVDDDEPAIVKDIMGQETQVSDTLPDEEFEAAAVSATRSRDQRFGEDEFELEEEQPRSNRLLFGVGAVALLAGIVLIATQLFGGDDPAPGGGSGGGSTARVESTPRPSTPRTTRVDPSTVVVRVFNGTQINGLARKATDELKAADYSVGEPQTRSSSVVQSTTQVMYRQNFKTAATQIAKELGVPSSSVQPIDTDTSVDAGETAEVVVITGADLDDGNAASGTTTTG